MFFNVLSLQRLLQLHQFRLHTLRIENCRGCSSGYPAASFPRIDDQGISPAGDLGSVGMTIDDYVINTAYSECVEHIRFMDQEEI